MYHPEPLHSTSMTTILIKKPATEVLEIERTFSSGAIVVQKFEEESTIVTLANRTLTLPETRDLGGLEAVPNPEELNNLDFKWKERDIFETARLPKEQKLKAIIFDMDGLNYIGHKLHHLDLSTTKLTNLPTAWLCSSIPSLTTFNMSHNSVTHLMDQDLWFVPNIEQLNLAGNLLTTLPTCVFAHLASLLALDLSDNTISSIPGNELS